MDLSNENVIHVKKNGVEYLQFRKLLEYKDIVNHAYTLGLDANYRTANANKQPLDKDVFEKNLESYKNIANAIGENYINIVKCNQNHTRNVKLVNNKINKNAPDFNLDEYDDTDGLITNKKDIILATTNADCILLLLFDPVKKVIANVHSGWKGTLQRISVNCVKKLIEDFGCNPEDILCFICPSIRKCHFEVDKEVKNMFEKEFKDLKNIEDIIEKKSITEVNKNILKEQKRNENDIEEKWNIDTVLINKTILQNEGLKKENIIDCGLCSVCNSELIHSFRVEKERYGLETALIKLK